MAHTPIPAWFYSLVVVRKGERFLVIREAKHGQKWYLPAGRAEPGETLVEAAHRETFEEAGISIVLEGILKLQHTPISNSARVRAIFLAHPADETPPRRTPNEHTLEARWVTLDELTSLPLRGSEVGSLFDWVSDGAPVFPLEVLGDERNT
jgi:phosphatase NudJ